MKQKLEDSWERIETAVERHTYEGANPWAFVALVLIFVVAYVLIGYLELPTRIESAIAGLAGWVLGTRQSRTFKPNGSAR